MTSIAQRSFAGGEVAPALYGRSDTTKYGTGLKTCRNFIVRRHGGVQNRPGTGLVAEQKTSATLGRLMKWVYNASQTYVLLFENQSMRVIQNGAYVVVSGVAAYNGATAYVLGDLVSSAGINYYAKQATTGNAPPNATYWHPLTGNIYEIPTPYLSADIHRLKRDQSGDVVTLTHPSYAIRELRRTGNTAWTLIEITVGPTQAAPTSPTNTGAAGALTRWVITAVNSETFEESLPTVATTSSAVPTSGAPITVNWTNAAGAGEYNVYRAVNGINSFVGIAASGVTGFIDTGTVPDTTETPPQARNPFSSASNYPSTSSYWQQRHVFGNTVNAPEKVWTSKSGSFKNFSTSSPLQDDDGVTFTVSGNEVQDVRHMISLGEFIILTSGGEWVIRGDQDGVLKPGAINPSQQGYTGASWVTPAIVGNNAIYVQARGSIVRDLRYELTSQGYAGRDMSVFSTHLFEGYTIGNGATGLDYQQIPESVVWGVRSDGGLLGLTYLREHEIWGWHRHDTDGDFEDVCCVPEGEEDAVYAIVKRTVNGATKRYVERFYSRRVTDIKTDAKFVDCGLTYDGRNTGATTVTLSGGTAWLHTETLTVTAALGTPFVAGDVGNAIKIWQDVTTNAGLWNEATTRTEITINITGYTSSTVVTGRANMTVPALFRTGARTTWGRAVDDLSGLGHLEGKALSILGDGDVISNGVDSPLYTVTSGAVTLPRPYMVIHAGLPYRSDFETLDPDTTQAETIRDKKKLTRSVTLLVQESRGIWVGPDLSSTMEKMVEYKQRSQEAWGETTRLLTGKVEINIPATWRTDGSVAARQQDPLPLSILSCIPSGDIGG